MCKRGLPSCGVCPSVSPSVTFMYSVETSKRILKLFQHHSSFSTPISHGSIPTGTSLTWASNAEGVGTNRDSRRISDYRIDDCWSAINNTVTVRRVVYRTDRHASLNSVYHSQHGRPLRRGENRTEFNLYAARQR